MRIKRIRNKCRIRTQAVGIGGESISKSEILKWAVEIRVNSEISAGFIRRQSKSGSISEIEAKFKRERSAL